MEPLSLISGLFSIGVFALAWFACAVGAGAIASAKGRSGFGWFVLGCLIALLAVIIVACLPSLKNDTSDPSRHGQCPHCKEVVRLDAAKCKHCHSDIEPGSLIALPPKPQEGKYALYIILGLISIYMLRSCA